MSQEPVRVVQVVSRLNAGGVAVQVLNAVAGIDGDGFECSVVTGRVGEDEADMLGFASKPARLKIIPELGRRIHPFADLIAFIKLCDYFRDVKPRIVHTHTSKAGALGRLAALAAHVPIIVHSYHGHVFRHYFGPVASRAIMWAERALGRATDAICLPCESQAREISEEFRIVPPRKTRIVRYGIDIDKLSSPAYGKMEARSYLGIRSDAKIVGSVGRLAPIKNHALLLEAFRLLSDRMNADLLIHGGGECWADIMRRVDELGLAGKVHYVQWVKDLRIVYDAIDVLAITSKAEGMPISAIEAMVCGVPVVAAAVGGLPDLLAGGRGVLIENQSAESMAAWLHRALSAPFDIETPREFVRQNHGLDALSSDTRALYLSLLEEKP